MCVDGVCDASLKVSDPSCLMGSSCYLGLGVISSVLGSVFSTYDSDGGGFFCEFM